MQKQLCGLFIFSGLALGSMFFMDATPGQVVGADPAPVAAAPVAANAAGKPVETSMHEFMEYIFQPTYKRLKVSMATEPADKNGWRGIKSDALILAEGGNLLLMHKPKDDVAEWNKMSIEVRDAGGEFYNAAKKRDFKAAKTHYESMLKKCNACHDHFADGKHQLTP